VVVVLAQAWFAAEEDVPEVPGLRGLFVQYPGHEVRPPLASRCERSESVPSGSMARLSEVLGGFWDNGTF
jgi:hypothetical protein